MSAFGGKAEVANSIRRFPPPWSVEDIGAAFVVRGSPMSILRRSRADDPQPKLLSKDEGRVAMNIALNGTSMGQTGS